MTSEFRTFSIDTTCVTFSATMPRASLSDRFAGFCQNTVQRDARMAGLNYGSSWRFSSSAGLCIKRAEPRISTWVLMAEMSTPSPSWLATARRNSPQSVSEPTSFRTGSGVLSQRARSPIPAKDRDPRSRRLCICPAITAGQRPAEPNRPRFSRACSRHEVFRRSC